MAEGDEAAVAEREVEAGAGHAEDRGLGGEGDEVGLAGEVGGERDREEAGEDGEVEEGFAGHQAAPMRPVGRQTRMTAIRM